ncbi:MAG: acyl-CoA thioesterase [Pseudomonadales bacterium]
MATEWVSQVRSTDIDGDGIVNNARYFEFFEQARLEHIARLGLLRAADGQHARRFTIAETTCRYRSPLRFGDWIVVSCRVSGVRVRSFDFVYEIRLRDSGVLAAEGSSAQVWLDTDGRPTPLPEDLRHRLEADTRQ